MIFSKDIFAFDTKIFEIKYGVKPPTIDGLIDDEAWLESKLYSDFTQTVPKPDLPSVFKTEVKMCYTNYALYVSAIMHQPKHITLKQLTARDGLNRSNADVFSIFLDTYNDKQNGFAFRVSSAGVQQDERLSNGNESGDIAWDAVWRSSVKITDSAWMVEMEIPLSAIRFTHSEQQSWRVNFLRLVRKKNESSYWNRIDVNKQGFLAQTGELKGIENVKPPVRLFLYPYVSLGYFEQPTESGIEHKVLKSGGMDLKYGLNESFTLDMTLVPDFSQVVSDNIVRNLSPFEQQLTENRPFFTEGTELFNKSGLFYSRRIGGKPSGYNTVKNTYEDTSLYEIEKNPNVTRLYNAFKISGRNKQNLGIGIFNAVGAPAHAEVLNKSTNEHLKIETEPLTNYNVLVLDQPLKGQSNINFTNTNVLRNGTAKDANASSLNWIKFDKSEKYRFGLNSKMSIEHDNSYLIGTMFGGEFSKVSGKLRYSLQAETQSPNYNQSAMGIQFDYNNSKEIFSISYNQNKPKIPFLQLYSISMNHSFAQNSKPFDFKYYELSVYYFLLFKSFLDITFSFESRPIAPIDFYQLGAYGKKLKMLPYFYAGIDGSTDSRKKIFWGYYLGYGISNIRGADYINMQHSLRYQMGTKTELQIKGSWTADNSNIGFAYFDNIISEPIVGRRNVKEINSELSFKYNFTPVLNLTGRIRHYNSKISYKSFHTINSEGEWTQSNIAPNANYNENFNLQNIDIFFNWIFKPGSRVVISYKQWLNDAYVLNSQFENNYGTNFYHIIKSPHAFELSARVIYFLDYNSLSKRKINVIHP